MVTAEIKAIHFAPGQMVNQGDLLVEFDPADYQLKYAVAERQGKNGEGCCDPGHLELGSEQRN